ncbi:MAG: FtsW/RodA/SpoVE family cell cycle protein [Schleiferiaceae bacterium]|nr:FtsW/RodA/SpoVE family cell cycle protein [Schleiferiaceae bacterium]
MERFTTYFQGSTQIWMITLLLAVFSFLPVFSASTSVYMHMGHIILGLVIAQGVHRVPYRFFGPLSTLFLWISLGLLVFTIAQGQTIGGANSSRWIYMWGMSFQPSALASVTLMVFLSRKLSKHEGPWEFKASIKSILWPIFAICALVLPANFSTTALLFTNSMILLAVGGYPLKHVGKIVGAGILFLAVFILIAKAFPEAMPNRVDTWMARIDTFTGGGDEDDTYQTTLAMTAIAEGGVKGMGPGRGLHKHFLPQNNSDFIYATIVEEYGLIGGTSVLLMYLWFMLASVRVARRAHDLFGRLVVIGLSFSISLQAMINMAVAVNLFPVTGQTLPLVSAGGSSIWMTCLAIGIILAVSRGRGDGETMDADMDAANSAEIETLKTLEDA